MSVLSSITNNLWTPTSQIKKEVFANAATTDAGAKTWVKAVGAKLGQTLAGLYGTGLAAHWLANSSLPSLDLFGVKVDGPNFNSAYETLAKIGQDPTGVRFDLYDIPAAAVRAADLVIGLVLAKFGIKNAVDGAQGMYFEAVAERKS